VVPVDPGSAFDAFTSEIDAWYVRGPYSWNDPERAVGMRIEPGVGGRWIEVWDAETGEGFDLGTITAWEPGERLVVSFRAFDLPPEPRTEIEVRFEPIAEGTRVTLEHRGLDRLPATVAEPWQRRAWIGLMRAFADFVFGPRTNRPPT
jgi:uncharacterized protein YndB with AHSA1/START domain